MQYDKRNTSSVVDDLLAGKPLEHTINRRLREGRGAIGRATSNIRKIGSGISGTLTGMTGKVLAAAAAAMGVWVANQLIQKWVTPASSRVKGKHSKIMHDSYEPMIRDVLKALQPALVTATQQVSQGQAVDANRIVAKERVKIIRVVDAHFMEMVKKLRVDTHQTILEDVRFKLDEALTTQLPQSLNDPDQLHGSQVRPLHF